MIVRLAIGFGPETLGPKDDQGDEGYQIGDHLEELVRHCGNADLQHNLKSIAEAEEQAGREHAARGPTAEDDCREGDEATAGDDALRIGARIAKGEESPAQAGKRTADDASYILRSDDIDAERLGGLGILADCPEGQSAAEAGKEQGLQGDQKIGEVRQRGLVEQRGPDYRNRGEAGDRNGCHLGALDQGR